MNDTAANSEALSQNGMATGHTCMKVSMTSESHVESFEQHRALLFGIAWRMLGNAADAEDVLQEALVRWLGCDPVEIRSPRAFLVTVVTRLCLNHLDLAHVRKERPFEPESTLEWLASKGMDPADDVALSDALDAAFSVMLRCLSPIERAVFLLREVFECEYHEVARIVEKSEDNCRQILRRARERIAGRDSRFEVKIEQQENLLNEFLNATASGDLDRLARALSSESTLVCDGENLGAIAPPPIHGAAAISRYLVENLHKWLSGGLRVERSCFGAVPVLMFYRDAQLQNALAFVLRAGQVRTIYLISCPVRLRSLSAQRSPLKG